MNAIYQKEKEKMNSDHHHTTTTQISITHDFPPFFRVHNTGHIERYLQHDFIPPSHDSQTDVVSKDVIISPENHVSARIYLPKTANQITKLPLLIYIHGGAFSIQSAFSSLYHPYLNALASKSGALIVSIEYRLAPEHPIPACYDDSWTVMNWIGSGSGSDPWINEYADFNRVYLAGDSAGANIAHNMVIRVSGSEPGYKIAGLVLIHPFFGMGGSDKLWEFICPDSKGPNDLRLNPGMDLLSGLKCGRVLVCVAERDHLRERGLNYFQKLKKSDWSGVVEFFETPGEEHVFHLFDPVCEKAACLLERIVGFVNCKEEHVKSHY